MNPCKSFHSIYPVQALFVVPKGQLVLEGAASLTPPNFNFPQLRTVLFSQWQCTRQVGEWTVSLCPRVCLYPPFPSTFSTGCSSLNKVKGCPGWLVCYVIGVNKRAPLMIDQLSTTEKHKGRQCWLAHYVIAIVPLIDKLIITEHFKGLFRRDDFWEKSKNKKSCVKYKSWLCHFQKWWCHNVLPKWGHSKIMS